MQPKAGDEHSVGLSVRGGAPASRRDPVAWIKRTSGATSSPGLAHAAARKLAGSETMARAHMECFGHWRTRLLEHFSRADDAVRRHGGAEGWLDAHTRRGVMTGANEVLEVRRESDGARTKMAPCRRMR